MKDLEQFAGKRMPYKESDDYVTSLLADCADKAVAAKSGRGRDNVKTLWVRISSVAAVVAVMTMLFVNLTRNSEFDTYKSSETLAAVLESMSDEQVMDLYCYELDEIPEYYEY